MAKQLFFLNHSFLVLSKEDYNIFYNEKNKKINVFNKKENNDDHWLTIRINDYFLIKETDDFLYFKNKNAKKYFIKAKTIKGDGYEDFTTYFSKFNEDGLYLDGYKFIEAIKPEKFNSKTIWVNLNDILYFEYEEDNDDLWFVKNHENEELTKHNLQFDNFLKTLEFDGVDDYFESKNKIVFNKNHWSLDSHDTFWWLKSNSVLIVNLAFQKPAFECKESMNYITIKKKN